MQLSRQEWVDLFGEEQIAKWEQRMSETNHHEPRAQTTHSWGALTPREREERRRRLEEQEERRIAMQGLIVIGGVVAAIALIIGLALYGYLT